MERLWSKWNSHKLLVGSKCYSDFGKHIETVSYKAKYILN